MFVIVSRYLVPKGFGGLTIFPFILLGNKSHVADAVYINHEKIHLRQQLEMLILPFFIWYGCEFLIRWIQYKTKADAYKNISFEREAYQKEAKLDYLASRSFWAFLGFL